jgi:transcriptional regulator with PAS, ATPase and Fis domain
MMAVEKGSFRNDLYYRINVVPIHLPSLRERLEDIPLLLDHFLEKYNRKYNRKVKGFSVNAMNILSGYPWPGNVRELQHMLEQILVLEKCDFISAKHIPVNISRKRGVFDFSDSDGNGHLSLEGMEKRYIRFILTKTGGIRHQAAEILQINRKTLSAKIKKYELDV